MSSATAEHPEGEGLSDLSESAQRRTRRRRRRAVVAGIVLVLAAVGALAAIQLLQARRDLVAGAQQAREAARLAAAPGTLKNAHLRAVIRQDLSQAQRQFQDARSNLTLWSPLLRRLGWAPKIGPQLAAAPPTADAAYYTTRAALTLVNRLLPLVPAGKIHTHHLLIRAARTLDQSRPELHAAMNDVLSASIAVRDIPRKTGNGSLDSATILLRSYLPNIQAFLHWLEVAPTVLGTRHPSVYLLTFQNPAELHATGGFIGATGLLTVRNGRIHTAFSGSSMNHDVLGVKPPAPETAYTPEKNWIFNNSNWSPDFPLSARLERWFYGEDTGKWVNGVIAVQDTAIGSILGATGPVYVPAYRRSVDAGNVTALAQQFVNGTYHGPMQGSNTDAVRKQFFGWVARAILKRLQTLSPGQLRDLGSALGNLVLERAITVYDTRPRIEAAIRRSGVDGAVRPIPGDFLSIVDDNLSYNKLNPYVHETATYDIALRRDWRIEATLTLKYHVSTSPANLEGAGPGLGKWGTKHDYQDFVRVYVPAGARLLHMTGADPWPQTAAYGLTQFAGRLIVRENRTQQVTLRYEIPGSAIASNNSKYRLTVRQQPGSNIAVLNVILRTGGTIQLGAGGPGQSVMRRVLVLNRDAHLRVNLGSYVQSTSVSLQHGVVSLRDPYIPYASFNDKGHGL